MSHLKIVRVSAKRLCLSNYSCNSMEYNYNQDLTLTKCSICRMHFSDKIMQQNAIETYCRNPKKDCYCNFLNDFCTSNQYKIEKIQIYFIWINRTQNVFIHKSS